MWPIGARPIRRVWSRTSRNRPRSCSCSAPRTDRISDGQPRAVTSRRPLAAGWIRRRGVSRVPEPGRRPAGARLPRIAWQQCTAAALVPENQPGGLGMDIGAQIALYHRAGKAAGNTSLKGSMAQAATTADGRLAIRFINWAHALDHFVMLIFPTVVIWLEVVNGRSYAELIALGTASFVAFGVFSLPAGWLGDHWSRRNMLVLFYAGCGLSLVAAGLAPNLIVLAVALFALGVFAAIYHPVGTA